MNVTAFRGDHEFLSNFYEHDQVGPSGLTYKTAEAAFQAAKTRVVEDQRRIAAAGTPNEAKRLGQRVTLIPDWDTTARHAAMRAVLESKFEDADLAAKLHSTGTAELIEGNTWHDQFWGDCQCGRPACARPGENWLGRYLMELRSEIRLDRIKTAPRSVSQLKNYKDCGHRYYLERVERAWQRPAAWFPQGTAVHRAAEVYELTSRKLTLPEAQAVFEVAYMAEVNDMLAETPRLDWWFASGSYSGDEDIPRRFEIGREQVAKYLEYFGEGGKAADIKVWVAPDGTPGIELEFEVGIDGVRVRGKIDTVMVKTNRDGTTEIIVVDNKTGLKPGDDFQLAVYAVALHELYGVEVKTGFYWMAKTTGHLTRPYDLSAWTREAVSAEFAAMDAAVKAERFEPTADPKNCERCSVSTSCKYFGKIPLA